MKTINDFRINYCDNTECNREILPGEKCLMVTHTEIAGGNVPYLPTLDEFNLNGLHIQEKVSTTFGEKYAVKSRLYPIRIFCNAFCLSGYFASGFLEEMQEMQKMKKKDIQERSE